MNSTEQSFLNDQPRKFGVVLLLQIRQCGEDAVRLWRKANVYGLQGLGQLRHLALRCRVSLENAARKNLNLVLARKRNSRLLPVGHRGLRHPERLTSRGLRLEVRHQFIERHGRINAHPLSTCQRGSVKALRRVGI